MADTTNHPTAVLQDALDGRLDASQRAALDEHLATCLTCRRELEALGWAKDLVRGSVRTDDTLKDLTTRLTQALDAEDARVAAPVDTPRSAAAPVGRYWIAAAAAVVLIAASWFALYERRADPPSEAAGDFRALLSGAAPVQIETADPAALETALRAANLPFTVRVFDFAMMSYALVGGNVQGFARTPSARFVYRGPDGRMLVCRMYLGDAEALPPPYERRRQNEIDFSIYREGELTVVFWQEGQVLCVLVADGDREAAIRLAVAKAMKP